MVQLLDELGQPLLDENADAITDHTGRAVLIAAASTVSAQRVPTRNRTTLVAGVSALAIARTFSGTRAATIAATSVVDATPTYAVDVNFIPRETVTIGARRATIIVGRDARSI